MAKWIAIVFLALLPTAFISAAQKDPESDLWVIPRNYITGTDWQKMMANTKTGYAMGIIDGFILAGAKLQFFSWIQPCVEGKTSGQMVAVFDKYIADHPMEWNHGMHILSLNALMQNCPNAPR